MELTESEKDMYFVTKIAMLATPMCPDGIFNQPCIACMAKNVVKELSSRGATIKELA